MNKNSEKSVIRRFSRELQRRKTAIESELSAGGEKQKIAEAIQQIIATSGTWPLEKVDFQAIIQGVKATVPRAAPPQKVFAAYTSIGASLHHHARLPGL